MEKVYIHVGGHKTGSSSIQRTFFNYDDGNLVYAPFDGPNHSPHLWTLFQHNYLDFHLWKTMGLSSNEIENRRQKYNDILVGALRRTDRHSLLLSAEDICHFTRDELVNLVQLIRKYCENIVFICYVRDPLSYLASEFQQRVRIGSTSLDTYSPYPITLLKRLLELVDKDTIIVRKYSYSDLEGGDACTDIARIVDAKLENYTPIQLNSSLKESTIKCLYVLASSNPLILGDTVLFKAWQTLIKKLETLFSDDRKLKPSFFTERAKNLDLDFLHDTFGIVFNDSSDQDSNENLELWLSEKGDDRIIDTLLKELQTCGLESAYDRDLVKIINRLFYEYMARAMCKANPQLSKGD